MTAGQQESEYAADFPLPTLSRDCKRQIAMLIANLIELHLSSQIAFDAEPAKPVHSSSNCSNSNNASIKEDCHAHR